MKKIKIATLICALGMAGATLLGACTNTEKATESASENTEDSVAATEVVAEEDAKTDEDASENTETENANADGKIKVIIGASNMADPFYSWLANSTAKAFGENYPEVEYKIVDLQGDDANVPTAIEQAMIEGYSGLIIDKPTHAQNTDQLLQDAHAEGVYTVLSNNSNVQDGVSSSSGASNYILGEAIGKQASETLPENAKICVLLSSPGDQGSEDRWKGYQDALEAAGRSDIEILDLKNNDGWAKEKAMNIMEDWLQIYPEIDGVLAMNDGMALGAIEACKADGRDVQNMQFFGIDGLEDACMSIEAGELTASVLQDAGEIGGNAARIVMEMISGKITEPEEFLAEPISITKANVSEIMALHESNKK